MLWVDICKRAAVSPPERSFACGAVYRARRKAYAILLLYGTPQAGSWRRLCVRLSNETGNFGRRGATISVTSGPRPMPGRRNVIAVRGSYCIRSPHEPGAPDKICIRHAWSVTNPCTSRSEPSGTGLTTRSGKGRSAVPITQRAGSRRCGRPLFVDHEKHLGNLFLRTFPGCSLCG
jgi:hypothetical protein